MGVNRPRRSELPRRSERSKGFFRGFLSSKTTPRNPCKATAMIKTAFRALSEFPSASFLGPRKLSILIHRRLISLFSHKVHSFFAR